MADDIASIGVKIDTQGVQSGIASLESLAQQGPKVEKALDGVEKAAAKSGKTIASLGQGAGKGLEDVSRSASGASISLGKLSEGLRAANSAQLDLVKSSLSLSTVVKAAGSAFAVWNIGAFVKDSTLLSARFETMGVVMGVAGNNAGYTRAQMEELSKSLQDSGISMLQSRNSLTQLATAHIDLSNAAKLGRAAQDLAVVGNVNSSEALARMIHGIKAGEVEVLRTLGLNVRFEDGYKKLAQTLGVSADSLTEQQKVLARTNAALDAAAAYTGIYEESMTTAGKAMSSMTRYWEDFQVKAGDAFLPTLTTGVFTLTDALKAANAELSKAGQEGLIESVANALNGTLKTALQTVGVLGANVAYVFSGVGREMGGIAAQAAAVARLDFSAAAAIREEMLADNATATASLYAFEARVMGTSIAAPGKAGVSETERMAAEKAARESADASQREADAETALTDARMRAAGINKQYFTDLKAYQDNLKLGKISEKDYIAEVTALAKRTYDSSTAGKDAKKGASGAKSAASLAERMNAAATSLDLSAIAKKYEELTSIYAGSEQILETLRRSGIMGEQEFYASKIQFVNLNIDAKKRELEEENKVLQAQNATGVRDINRDKKIADNQAKINKLTIEAAMQTENLGLQAEAAEDAQVGQFTAARQAAEDYLAVLQRGFDRDVLAVGWGDNRRNIESGRNQIQDKYADQRRDYENQRDLARANAGGTLSADIAKQYQDKIDLTRTYEKKALDSYVEGVGKRLAAESDWVNGAARAFENYSYTASNVAQQTADLFSNAFKGMEDSLVNFAMTGKLDFKSLADSIIADLIRIQARAAISNMFGGGSGGGGLLGSIVSGVSSLFGGGAATGAATGAGTMSAPQGLGAFDGGGYTGDGGKYQPAGIVHKGEYVINAESTKRIGLGLLSRLNGYANGGLVGGATAVVGAGIGGGTEINIHNYSGAPVEQRQSTGADGKVIVDLFIGEAASQLANGYGLMDQAMRARKNQGM